jgi:hypothetical protein
MFHVELSSSALLTGFPLHSPTTRRSTPIAAPFRFIARMSSASQTGELALFARFQLDRDRGEQANRSDFLTETVQPQRVPSA